MTGKIKIELSDDYWASSYVHPSIYMAVHCSIVTFCFPATRYEYYTLGAYSIYGPFPVQFKSLLLHCIVLVLLEGEPITEEMAARFVSMIPMIGGSTLFPGLFDIWLTSDVSKLSIYSPFQMGLIHGCRIYQVSYNTYLEIYMCAVLLLYGGQ